MSILIKGVKMPKHDGEILCIDIHPDGTVCMNMDLKCRKIAEAKELPPHGRLIDADALIDDLEHDVRNDERVIAELEGDLPDGFIDIRIATTQDDKDIKQNCIVLLREQPTIIEAEEEM